MLDAQTLTQLRTDLGEEGDRVRAQLRDLAGNEFDEGFADTSQVTAERGEIEALSSSLSETLSEIEDALTKFDAGTYGTCESCSQEITKARLEAMPMARLCTECATSKR